MSYVVIRGCSPEVNVVAFGRWFRNERGDSSDVMEVIERLYAGKRYELFLGNKEAARFVRKAGQWGVTGITLYDDDDMSEYPPPLGFWVGVRWRLGCWMDK